MSLAAVLEKARSPLAARWVEAANAVYPFAAAGFLRTVQNAFANPVGQRSRDLSEILFTAVIGKAHDGKALKNALEEFVKVRAMQDVPVETSLQVMFAYKAIIRDYVKEHTMTLDEGMRKELDAMDDRCDTLALLAFGVFARSREAFFEARINDMRRRNAQVMRLARRHGLAAPEEFTQDETGAPDARFDASVASADGADAPGRDPV